LPFTKEIVDLCRLQFGLPMAGFEPARAFSAQRILSPLRLPFRHIGMTGPDFTRGACQTNCFYRRKPSLKKGN
jgi:hypothetical protein